MERVRISKHIRPEDNKFIPETISSIWYMIPTKDLFKFFIFDYQKGRTCPIPVIRKEFLSTNDVGLLAIKKHKKNEFQERGILYFDK